jgi:hypothetical protein
VALPESTYPSLALRAREAFSPRRGGDGRGVSFFTEEGKCSNLTLFYVADRMRGVESTRRLGVETFTMLEPCPECKKSISSYAEECPHCGCHLLVRWYSAHARQTLVVALVMITLCVVMITVLSYRS